MMNNRLLPVGGLGALKIAAAGGAIRPAASRRSARRAWPLAANEPALDPRGGWRPVTRKGRTRP